MSEERLVKRTLKRSIGYLGKSYGPGEVMVPLGLAKQLAPVPDDEAEAPAEDLADPQADRIAELEAEVESLKAQVAAGNAGDDDTGTPLPEEFVNKQVRELLMGAGFTTLEKVDLATDEQLLALDGIAEGRLKEIREASTALKTQD